MTGVLLEWVLLGGDIQHVSVFSNHDHRPDVFCPVCNEQVILKLGKINAHHAAHKPGVKCIVTEPESVLHLNTKLYIAKQLESATRLLTNNRCDAEIFKCKNTQFVVLAEDWNGVEVETIFDSRRPDIALVRDGEIILAIEVRVSNAVNQEKAKDYKDRGIRWCEIKAHESIYTPPTAWRSDKPLKFSVVVPSLDSWICAACKPQYKGKNNPQPVMGIIYDIYHDGNARRTRLFYEITEITRDDGEVISHLLWMLYPRRIMIKQAGHYSAALRNLMDDCDMDAYSKAQGSIFDSPTGWIMNWNGKYEDFPYRDTSLYPPRYQWDITAGRWVLDSTYIL